MVVKAGIEVSYRDGAKHAYYHTQQLQHARRLRLRPGPKRALALMYSTPSIEILTLSRVIADCGKRMVG